MQRQERRLRFAWNRLVNWHRCALHDWDHGRQTALLAEYRTILENKNGNTGHASPAARRNAAIKKEAERLATEQNISVEEAKIALDKRGFEPVIPTRDEVISTKIQILQHGDPKRPKGDGYGANGTGTGPRRLSVTLAHERLAAKAKQLYGPKQKCLLNGLIQKFQKSCENWLKLKGTAQAPRYKRDQDNVALQRQIGESAHCVVGPISDLSAMLGQEGAHCKTIWHRPLPEGAIIKQLAITGHSSKRELVIFFECPRESVLKPFAKSDSCAGIVPGLDCAFTVVSNAYSKNAKVRRKVMGMDFNLSQKLADDPESNDAKALAGALKGLEQFIFRDNGVHVLQPPLARDKHFLAKLRRIQRKKERQKRAANPDCFNLDGTWKKGKRASQVTANLLETHLQEQKLHEHIVNFRRDYYHQAAFHLLRQHGHLKAGDWQPKPLHKEAEPLPPGQAKKRRNINRKGLDHAIASFISILKDKASLSASPRTVDIVKEHYTTSTCGCCLAETGPQGPTNVVYWTCSKCGAENHRKGNAAENIRISAAVNAAVTAGAQPAAAPARST